MPARCHAEACPNTALPPPSRTIKPNPLVTLYHLTVPISSTVGPSGSRSASGRNPVRGGRATAPPVLVSTLITSVTCGPRCPWATRTSSVSPGLTSLNPPPPSTVPCTSASPGPSDNSTKPNTFSVSNHLTTALTADPARSSNRGLLNR